MWEKIFKFPPQIPTHSYIRSRNSPPKEMTDRRKRKQGQRPMTISSKVKRNTQQSKDHDAFILLKPVNIQNYRVDQEYKSCRISYYFSTIEEFRWIKLNWFTWLKANCTKRNETYLSEKRVIEYFIGRKQICLALTSYLARYLLILHNSWWEIPWTV